MSVSATKYIWRALPIIAAISFAYATVLVKLSRDWWTDENYSHGLLIPFIIGYILWSEREKLAAASTRPSFLWGGIAVAVALFALWAGVAGAELYTQRISLILLLAGTVVYFWGAQLLRFLLVPLTLLFLAIPIPAIIFNKIAFPLQLFASSCAVWSMSVLGIPVLRRERNRVKPSILSNQKARSYRSSGIRSLMTLVTLAVVFAYFTYPNDTISSRAALYAGYSYGFWRTLIIVSPLCP